MTYEEALQIAKEELDDKIAYLSQTFEDLSAKIEGDIYSLSMARKALIQASEEKREWVGLTDEDIQHAMDKWCEPEETARGMLRGIEAKLKEKNT